MTGAALRRAARFCVNNIKLTEGGLLARLQHGAEAGALRKNGFGLHRTSIYAICSEFELNTEQS